MATVTPVLPSLKDPQHTGQYGNASLYVGALSGQAAQGLSSTTDTVILNLLELPAGSLVDIVELAWSAFGTAASLKLGFKFTDPARAAREPSTLSLPTAANDYFFGATDVSAAGSTRSVLLTAFTSQLPVVIYATVSGSSGTNIIPAAAKLRALLIGRSNGPK